MSAIGIKIRISLYSRISAFNSAKDSYIRLSGLPVPAKPPLSLAGGLDAPKEGNILYKGENISKIGLTSFRNQYVSIVFQSYNLLPYMTALQNITSAMEITGSQVKNKEQYALEMLEKVGIGEKQARQKVLTLSGGQQQRVSIIRAFCCDTDLIVADEPTGNG